MEAPYFYIGFIYDSMPADGKMSIEQLLCRIFVEDDPKTMPAFHAKFTVFAGFIAGEYTGKATIEMQPVTPSGTKLPSHGPKEGEFKEDLFHAVHVRFPVEDLLIEESGVYWFDVKLNGHLHARIPLEVVYTPKRQKAFDH